MLRTGEGETVPGTVLFPKERRRSIEIVWKDPDGKTRPEFVTIRGCVSDWKAAHNISLGMSLKRLEKLNGRPFHLVGFDWDYSGTITSWDEGLLAPELNGGQGRVILRLSCSGDKTTPQEYSKVIGDRDFSSRHPVMQKMNPTVGEDRLGISKVSDDSRLLATPRSRRTTPSPLLRSCRARLSLRG